ncbi:hypothetical protein IF2G_10232 [Cordyceps javanica]|nr:hypothetical protein IF2G_10232 [Cordyceps javanica]
MPWTSNGKAKCPGRLSEQLGRLLASCCALNAGRRNTERARGVGWCCSRLRDHALTRNSSQMYSLSHKFTLPGCCTPYAVAAVVAMLECEEPRPVYTCRCPAPQPAAPLPTGRRL